MQHPQMLHETHDHEAPAKQSQHFNATYRNIVGRNMLRAFGHPVAMCCEMLGVVDSNLKMVKFSYMHDVVVVWPGSCQSRSQSLRSP